MASAEGGGGISQVLRHLLQANDKCLDHPGQQGTAPRCGTPPPVAHIRQDHFYVCVGHLKDKGFASPIIDPEEVIAKKRKEEMDREIELIKKEYEEKMKRKKTKKNDKKEDENEKDKRDGKKEEDDDAKTEKEKDDKVSNERPFSNNEYMLIGNTHKRSKQSPTKMQQPLRRLQRMIRHVSTLCRSKITDLGFLHGGW